MAQNTTDPTVIIPFEPWQVTLIIAFLTILCLAILLGNLLVIVAVFSQKFLRVIPNIYIVSLAFADLSVGLLVTPLGIVQIVNQHWTLGKGLCHFWLLGDVTLCTVSILHLCVIAIDRYRTITDGISYMHRRTLSSTIWTIVGIWVIALWISSPPLLGWHDWNHKDGDVYQCHLTTRIGYVIHSALGSLIFPLGLMIVLYWKIYRAIQQKLRERQKMGATGEVSTVSVSGDLLEPEHSEQIQSIIKAKQKFSLTRERRAAKTLGVIMGAFLICWGPFGFLYIIEAFLPEHLRPSDAIYEFITWLGYFNSALNPIIYTVYSMEFRKGFKRVLHLA